MKFIANILWLVFGGIVGFLLWTVAGLLLCFTIIGIPFGLQAFKIAAFVLWPFGNEVEVGDFGTGGLLANLLWIFLLGWELAIVHLLFALVFTITIVGIPFALQQVKLARLSLMPFGARIVPIY